MKVVRTTVALVALTTLLGACGLINSFIPDQDLNNALGLDGEEISLSQTASLLSPQQVISYSGPITATFTDFDASDVPDAVNPSTLSEVLGVEPSFEVSAAATADAFPAELTLSASELNIEISDASGPTLSRSYSAEDNLSISFAESGCVAGVPTTCTYTTSLSEVVLLTISLGGADLDTLYEDILTDNDSSNRVSGSFSLELDGALPAGATVKVVLDTRNGKLTF